MKALSALLGELIGLFVDDGWLALAILAVVAFSHGRGSLSVRGLTRGDGVSAHRGERSERKREEDRQQRREPALHVARHAHHGVILLAFEDTAADRVGGAK